jgi:hypothetical protein
MIKVLKSRGTPSHEGIYFLSFHKLFMWFRQMQRTYTAVGRESDMKQSQYFAADEKL